MRKEKLRLSFAGTPKIAAVILETLISRTAYSIAAIYTQPDRKAGRGQKLCSSEVKQLAEKHELPVLQPETTEAIDPENQLSEVDVLVVVAYGMLIPEKILHHPSYGCINVHTSLLPRWRGAAPIQRAIQAGDTHTGISIMQIDAGLDTGPIYMQERCAIEPTDTADTLENKLAVLGASCLIKTLGNLETNKITLSKQNNDLATYAPKITKVEAELDWSLSAIELERIIRAFNPSPIAYTILNGIRLRVWQASVITCTVSDPPGTIINCSNSGIDVTTGNGVLRLLQVQPSGKRVMSTAEFLHGRPEFIKTICKSA